MKWLIWCLEMRKERFWDLYYDFNNVISLAPGPSPWYLLEEQPKLLSKYGTLKWQEVENHAGFVILTTPFEETLAIFNNHCYIQDMSGSRFLNWHEPKIHKFNDPKHAVILHILDADKLADITNVGEMCEEMNKNAINIHFNNNALVDIFYIPQGLKVGTNEIDIPNEFKEINELLILALLKPIKWGKTAADTIMNMVIYDVKPKENIIEVIPQDWFNNGPYDFAWQAPWRVARDPKTGKIFGNGTRIGNFILDKTGRNVETWV